MIIQINSDELNKQIFILSCENVDKNSPFYNKKFIDESYSLVINPLVIQLHFLYLP